MKLINNVKDKKQKGLTTVETILSVLILLFFILGGLLMKFDRPDNQVINGESSTFYKIKMASEKNKDISKKEIKNEEIITKDDQEIEPSKVEAQKG